MVQPGEPVTRLLESLPQRPPTPPRESDNDRVRQGISVLRRVFSKDLRTSTPSISPSSSSESVNSSADKSQKKVTWIGIGEFPTVSSKVSTQSEQPLRLLPPPAEKKPIKSILKPYSGLIAVDRSAGTTFGAPHTYPNFATMLESIVKQLAGEDRSSRFDAYMTLSGVLRASEDIPDPKALKEKMSLLTQFIQRDMSAKFDSGALDTVLINNSLVLLSILVWKPACFECLSTEFCSYVVDRAVNAFEDPQVSKDVVKHFLFIISLQNFSAKVITSARVGRIIEALNSIEGRVRGRSIVLGRLTIYRKLLSQARASMLANISWIESLCTGMTYSVKDIRAAAITFGFEAALQLGAEKQASRAVMELFERQHGEVKYADSYVKRLSLMIRNKQEGASVPQIWSIILLFLRYHPQQLEYWGFITRWLKIIQECFNKSDREIKLQANLAWNRLVFAVYPDEKTTPTMIKMLGQALSGQLKRKLVGRNAKEERQVAIGSVCNLLYYALRPSATAAQLDLYWDEYVVLLVGRMLVLADQGCSPTEQDDLTQACAIIGALLDTAPKAWNNNRANENGAVQPEELPSIDPRWTRKNVHRVFTVLYPLIEKCFTDLGNKGSLISRVWKNFASSIASAGVKEVKVSNDTMAAMAFTFNMLYKIWLKGPGQMAAAEKGDSALFCTAFTSLVTTVITTLGVLPFTEKLLSIDPQETFTIVATPSHHPLKTRGDVRSPLYHLFTFLARPPQEMGCDENYLRMVKSILHPFFEARKLRQSRIEFLYDLSQYIPLSASSPSVSVTLWRVLAGFATAYVRGNEEGGSSGSHDQPLGAEYRNIVKILELGISLSPNEVLPGWTDLFEAVSAQATLEAGESSRAISVIEPLARVLQAISQEPDRHSSMRYCSLLVSNTVYPRDRQSLDMARRRLWGTATPGQKSLSFDPFLHLYTYLRQSLVNSYQILTGAYLESHIQLLLNIAELIQRCPVDLIVNSLKNIQEGVVPWLLDESLKYGDHKLPEVATSVSKPESISLGLALLTSSGHHPLD
jgi:Rap1-interacting factor 1 N terminal